MTLRSRREIGGPTMRATLQNAENAKNAENGVRARPTEDDQATAAGATTADQGSSRNWQLGHLVCARSHGSNDRFARLLNQKKRPDAVMTGVLALALLFGLVGFVVPLPVGCRDYCDGPRAWLHRRQQPTRPH